MLQGIDLNQIKQYNETLKQYKDKASALNAEIEYTNKEIDNICAELSAELGMTVTRDNIQQIYNEQVSMINNTLQSGNAVLAKIAGEEQAMQNQQVQRSVAQQPVVNTAPVQLVPPVSPIPPVTLQATAPVTPVSPVANSTDTIQPQVESQPQESVVTEMPQGTPGSIFGNPSTDQVLPPMFKLQF